eukprot:CAMPEP_0114327238 /NCGR_PEP_ID=MMETSP0059-20121206/30186_1 /TAXON_ID=36894 /ORGANISM="Pyramimonas parkeae, Strain CCMP726" /LENGTH=189 /DNA_ID=CAMNT_0001456335 /DNA_START=359 /DNA_END=929 /DNA_ORIENTATION=+
MFVGWRDSRGADDNQSRANPMAFSICGGGRACSQAGVRVWGASFRALCAKGALPPGGGPRVRRSRASAGAAGFNPLAQTQTRGASRQARLRLQGGEAATVHILHAKGCGDAESKLDAMFSSRPSTAPMHAWKPNSDDIHDGAREMLLEGPYSGISFLRRVEEDLRRRREKAAMAAPPKLEDDQLVKWRK